jgi:hypothetical protein
MYHTPETLLNHVFEDLRKPKAPNREIEIGIKPRISGQMKIYILLFMINVFTSITLNYLELVRYLFMS